MKVMHACTLGAGTATTWMLTGPFSGHIPRVDTPLLLSGAKPGSGKTKLIGSIIGAPRGLASIKILPIWGARPEVYVGGVVGIDPLRRGVES